MIYLDGCALIKLVRAEPGAAALASWLDARQHLPWFSSGLVRVELLRGLQRVEATDEEHKEAAALLDALTMKPVDTVLEEAAHVRGQHLRSLDAIHLATAQAAGRALSTFVTYDNRLADVAQNAGLPIAQPD